MNWGVELKYEVDEPIDPRLRAIINFVFEKYDFVTCILNDIDASGLMGDQLTKRINDSGGNLSINETDIQSLMSEDGQIFELDLSLKNSTEFRLIVRDGSIVIIIGSGDALPSLITGDCMKIEPSLYS